MTLPGSPTPFRTRTKLIDSSPANPTFSLANAARRKKATYRPQNVKNIAMPKKRYVLSLKLARSRICPLRRGGTRCLAKTLTKRRNNPSTRAIARIVHGKPICGIKFWTMAGKIRPPRALPDALIPMARDFFVEKYVATRATPGQKRHPLPIPTQIPCARMKCQYFVEIEAMQRPSNCITLPTKTTCLK